MTAEAVAEMRNMPWKKRKNPINKSPENKIRNIVTNSVKNKPAETGVGDYVPLVFINGLIGAYSRWVTSTCQIINLRSLSLY